jgi:HSP20 family protein
MARSLTPFEWGSLAPRGELGADSFFALHREMDRLFDSFLRDSTLPSLADAVGGSSMVAMPRIDVSETDREIRIEAELPGVREKDVDIELVDDMLSIRGKKTEDKEERSKGYHVKERAYGSFARSMRLPFNADPDQVMASFSNGVLTVTVPKPQETKDHARKIQIHGAESQSRTGSTPKTGA